jgi:hypothetical protein
VEYDWRLIGVLQEQLLQHIQHDGEYCKRGEAGRESDSQRAIRELEANCLGQISEKTHLESRGICRGRRVVRALLTCESGETRWGFINFLAIISGLVSQERSDIMTSGTLPRRTLRRQTTRHPKILHSHHHQLLYCLSLALGVNANPISIAMVVIIFPQCMQALFHPSSHRISSIT